MEQPAPNAQRERLLEYTVPNPIGGVRHQFTQVFIMLFGMLGHGKSSLINSCICVLNNCDFRNYCGAHNTDSASTTARFIYNLTQTLSIVDNRGFNKMNDEEMLEATAQLRSLRGMGEGEGEVTWGNSYEKTLNQLLSRVTAAQTTCFVPVLVVSADTPLNSSDTNGLETFVTETFRITGTHPILVITHSNSVHKGNVKKKFCDLGITHRFSLENYTASNAHRNTIIDNKILQFLETCTSEAEQGIKIRAGRPDHFIKQGEMQLHQEIKIQLGKKQNEIEDLKKVKEDLEKEKEGLKKEKEDLKKEKEVLEKELQEEKTKCAIL
ncbi:hypothetical protein XENTR_v10022971 [Xenopus tropicalis]|nr:hypothetical protein XENTR_v10022971 [Xenopus tropicalis]